MNYILFIIYIFFFNQLYGECSDLSYQECIQWPDYCEWNDDTDQCQDIGGGGDGGDDTSFGPYEYNLITESDGLRNGPDYRDGILYYPLGAEYPYKSIIITPGWGGGSSSMSSWAEFYASHGFIAMTIGPNDEINDSHQMRGEGLIDGIETIRQENLRTGSPLYGLIDVDNYSVSGYSMGGGACHNAAMIDSSIRTVISLNPTVLFEDCNYCPLEDGYCICLVPELIDHSIPSIIFAGEAEVNELPDYAGMLGQDIYANLPETTEKVLFEGAAGGHGSAVYPSSEVASYVLDWLKYQVLEDNIACEALLENPETASQYLTNINCDNSQQIEIQLSYGQDWNIVGIPVIVENSEIEIVYPESIENTMFSFGLEGYTLESSIENGSGYWLRFNEMGSSFITGNAIDELIINLNTDWNLISGISETLPVNSIIDLDNIIIDETIYGFSDGYYNSENLVPGNGYWIRALTSGQITLILSR